MNKPKYFKFSFPSGDPTGIARCAYDKAAIVAYRIPRGRIKDVKALEGSAHDDLQNPEATGSDMVTTGTPSKARQN